ncbi:hypothetical protein [Alishewanella longhuensis]
MEISILVLLVVFFGLLLLNVPITFSIGLATLATMLVSIDFVPAVTTMAQRMAGGSIALRYWPSRFLFCPGLLWAGAALPSG